MTIQTAKLKRYKANVSVETLDLYFPDVCDPSALHAELLALHTLKDRVTGVSGAGGGTVVHCVRNIAEDEMERIADVVDRHDGQLAEAKRAMDLELAIQRRALEFLADVTDLPTRKALAYLFGEIDALKGRK